MSSKTLLATLLFSLSIYSCSSVPVTGRKQFNIIPDEQMLSMSFQQYDEFLKTNKLSTNQDQVALVKRVGGRIQQAVERYMAEKNMSDKIKDYKWEFNVVESKEVNAWCMPGGKVVVYTGILPVTQDETGLAVVLGHEIAHAVAEHGGERMSQGLVAQFGGMALETALKDKTDATKNLWMTVYGVGAQYGALLPYSRIQESEADHMGVIFMAMAGYDPNKAVEFWDRMSKQAGGQKPPEFMSTHPADETRIENLKKWAPEAMAYYKTAKR
ncbi:MAG TPA: M48 family metallopeptidase [Bacteroidota bacterium]|nr:M48 family metallopeptidase [Bacteroidota bacterium]